MPDQYQRPYLDSNVYICAIRGAPPEPHDHVQIAQGIPTDAQSGIFNLHAATLIAVEVHKDKGQPALSGQQASNIDAYFTGPQFVWVELDLPLARKARDLARAHSMKPPDAIRLASAIRARCDQLLTWNLQDFPTTPIEGVECVEPHWQGQPQLTGGASPPQLPGGVNPP